MAGAGSGAHRGPGEPRGGRAARGHGRTRSGTGGLRETGAELPGRLWTRTGARRAGWGRAGGRSGSRRVCGQDRLAGLPKEEGRLRELRWEYESLSCSRAAHLEAPGSCSSSELGVSPVWFSLLECGLNQEFGLMVLPLSGCPREWAEAGMPKGEVMRSARDGRRWGGQCHPPARLE